MLLDYCIGKAAVSIKEFYILPVGNQLMQYDTIAINTIVKNKENEVSSCDILYADNLDAFNQEYLKSTKEVAETCQDRDLSENSMVIGTSAIINTEIDGAICWDTYENCEQGILVTSRLKCVKGKGNLPRFGKAFRLDERFREVEYLGRNGESYCDMKDHTQIEWVNCSVADMTEPNIRPQESGNRCECRYVKIADGSDQVGFVAEKKPFELGIKPYSDKELLDMKHREDEKITGTYVTISAFQMGIGTGSCGPATLPQYCYRADDEYELKFIIRE